MICQNKNIGKEMTKSDIKILFLSGNAELNLKVLYCLYPVFNNIHIVANKADSILKYSRYKKKFEYIPWSSDAEEQEECISKLQRYCDDHQIEVILPGDMPASGYLYRFQGAFERQKIFPVMAGEELEKIDNKWLFAQELLKEGLLTPLTMLIDTPDAINETNRKAIEEKIGFPLIIKPLFGESSHGVEVIKTFNDLKEHVLGDKPFSDLPQIIQTYVDGYDVGFSVIADKGKIHTMTVQLVKQADVLDYCSHKDVEVLGEKMVKFLNYSGAANFCMRIDYNTGEIYVLECNPRFWFTIPGAMWQGLNFPEAAVNYTAGKTYKKTGAIGKFRVPGLLIRMLLKKPWLYFTLTKNERNGLWHPILDPIPQLVKALRNL